MQNTNARTGRRERVITTPATRPVRVEEDTATVRQRISSSRRTGHLNLRSQNLAALPHALIDAPSASAKPLSDKITVLLLGDNHFERLPSDFVELFPNLQYLDLSGNKFASRGGSLPGGIADLESLCWVDLEGNPGIGDKVPGFLEDFSKRAVVVVGSDEGSMEEDHHDGFQLNSADESGDDDEEDTGEIPNVYVVKDEDRYNTDEEDEWNEDDEDEDRDSSGRGQPGSRGSRGSDGTASPNETSPARSRNVSGTPILKPSDPQVKKLNWHLSALSDRTPSDVIALMHRRMTQGDPNMNFFISHRYRVEAYRGYHRGTRYLAKDVLAQGGSVNVDAMRKDKTRNRANQKKAERQSKANQIAVE
ncbi:hypothetical protein BJ742DRAFT_838059 [Cladochytrium replicatum]|nr:hypothetical protein BJ742DRAFT_838059 [Cladochytrium replicatum]